MQINNHFTILQANLQGKSPPNYLVKEQDIFIFSELYDPLSIPDKLNPYFKSSYSDTAIYSKIPILSHGSILTDFRNQSWGHFAVLNTQNPILILSLHIPSPRTSEHVKIRNQLLAQFPQEIKSLLEKHKISNWIAAGDFNITPWNPHGFRFFYHTRSTPNFSNTWPSALYGLIGVPIDHIATNMTIKNKSKILSNINSDHYAQEQIIHF